MAAGTCRHQHRIARKAHGFRRENLVGFAVLKDAVLMNAGAVREGVRTDNSFVGRDRFVADLRDEH